MFLVTRSWVGSISGRICVDSHTASHKVFLVTEAHRTYDDSPAGAVNSALDPITTPPLGAKRTWNLPVFLQRCNHTQVRA